MTRLMVPNPFIRRSAMPLYRASAATTPMGGFGPAKPGLFCARWSSVTPHLWSTRPRRGSCLASRNKKPVKRVKDYFLWYNAQAIVDADGSQLILGTNVLSTTNESAGFEGMIKALCAGPGKPDTLLADAGYAGEKIVTALEKRGIDPLIAITRGDGARKYDFRPPPDNPKPAPNVKAQWRLVMQQKLQTQEAKQKYKKRKSTVEPVFGIIKSVLGFKQFHLRGIDNVKNEWNLVALAYNCKRLAKINAP